MNIDGLWPMYAWAGSVALAIVAGVVSARTHPDVQPSLPQAHVAGATLIGLFGWEMLVSLPSAVGGYWLLTAALGDLAGLQYQQAFLAAQIAYVVGAGFAVMGILWRRRWGSVLGIGLALAVVLSSILAFINLIVTVGESLPPGFLWEAFATLAAQSVPALAAAAMLIWPLRSRARPGSDAPSHEVAGRASEFVR